MFLTYTEQQSEQLDILLKNPDKVLLLRGTALAPAMRIEPAISEDEAFHHLNSKRMGLKKTEQRTE